MRRWKSAARRPSTRDGRSSPLLRATWARSTPRPLNACVRRRGPTPRDADELHDALLTGGFLRADEVRDDRWPVWLSELEASGRAARVLVALTGARTQVHEAGRDDVASSIPSNGKLALTLWFATERLPELCATHADAHIEAQRTRPEGAALPDRSDAVRELLRSRMEIVGPTSAAALGASLGVTEIDADAALVAIEAMGAVLRGSFTPGTQLREWCDRRLLARIHRYTLGRLRAEIEPVSAADLLRFLFRWQRVQPDDRAAGLEGLAAVIGQLEGFELPAAAWEGDVLPARCADYSPELLDMLCLSGRVAWGRLAARNANGTVSGPLRTSPIALLQRSDAQAWLRAEDAGDGELPTNTAEVLRVLEQRGACFFHEIVAQSRLLSTQVEQALGELVALGRITADSFAGMRALLTPSAERRNGNGRRRKQPRWTVETAGRWSLLPRQSEAAAPEAAGLHDDPSVELRARALLRRWGVVLRRLLERESNVPSWRDLVRVYRRMEARGEIRGGRFVSGFAGEQFALPEAVGQLRAVRREEGKGALIAVSAADPLNLAGILTPGDRVPALATNRVLFRDGIPIALLEAGEVHWLVRVSAEEQRALERALIQRATPAELRAYLRVNRMRSPRRKPARAASEA